MGWLDDVRNAPLGDPFGSPEQGSAYAGPGDTPGTPESYVRHPDWQTKTQEAVGIFSQTFKNTAGRDPTAQEISDYTSRVINPALSGGLGGPQTFQYTDYANFANNYIGTNFDVNKLRADKGSSDAPNQYGAVDQAFQSTVGRAATQDEKDHFGKLLASGEVNPYTLGQWLQQLPETVKKQDEEFRQGLSTEMQGQDKRYFEEQIMPSIQSQFAQQGRSVESSGFANALGQQATAQNRQREGFLSNLTASQYGGNKANAYQEYANSMAQVQGNYDYTRARSDALSDQSTNRLYELQNYNAQKTAYDEYLKNYGKRSSGQAMGSLIGGTAGAIAGSFSGTPFGVAAGWQAGSGIGGGVGSYF